MKQCVKEIIIYAILVVGIMLLFNIRGVRGHEDGHSGRIKEYKSGERTGWVEKADWCWAGNTRQNKVILSIDENRDDIVEECITLWYEHGRPHYISSKPDENGECHCEGYIWLEGDSQGEELWDFYGGWK